MTSTIQTIPFLNLALTFIPVMIVLVILFKWSMDARNALYAIARMLIQLLLIGYFLAFIFESDSAWLILLILTVMVLASSWIALDTVKASRRILYRYVFWSILLGGGVTLILVTEGVLGLYPWYKPQLMIPLAGMIFANSMNTVSLAAERFTAEMGRGVSYKEARKIALHAAMIPVINSLFAVGLVSLPGMMTGQILSGVSPLIAVRYQIMVMSMIFGSSGISVACFLLMSRDFFEKMQKS